MLAASGVWDLGFFFFFRFRDICKNSIGGAPSTVKVRSDVLMDNSLCFPGSEHKLTEQQLAAQGLLELGRVWCHLQIQGSHAVFGHLSKEKGPYSDAESTRLESEDSVLVT